MSRFFYQLLASSLCLLGLSQVSLGQASLYYANTLATTTSANARMATHGNAKGTDSSVSPSKDTSAGLSNNEVSRTMSTETNSRTYDYQANIDSDVYGAQLFGGSFSQKSIAQFNPDYAINIGDKVQVRLWGAFVFDEVLTVDPQGNIFLPHAGPVRLLGVKNEALKTVVHAALTRSFKNNVQSYASLVGAQPVRVFVGGNVNRPGMYAGTSMDGILNYLDQAGGVDVERGSFLDIQIKRGDQLRARINLYDFLLQGVIGAVQLADGDVIFVPPRQNTVSVSGLVENAKRFEFAPETQTVRDLMTLARPLANATHVRVTRNEGAVVSVEYFPLEDASQVSIHNGDTLEFTADKKPGTITVRVDGEHQSAQEYVLPYGSRMSSLLAQIHPTQDADMKNLQLFRLSVQQRQKEMLTLSLHNLESAVLMARSASTEEAQIRKDDAEMTLKWIEKAKTIQPLGQVLLSRSNQIGDMLLENGDRLYIPRQDALVLVSGEVLFPNAIAYDRSLGIDQYIELAGGLTANANEKTVIVARLDGSYQKADISGLFSGASDIHPGDQILVLPKVDEKSRQFWKDMTQIVFQIAVSAKALVGL